MNKWTSIYQAEAKAIETAALTLLNHNIMNEKIYIYSDSQAVLKALTKKSIKNEFILNCQRALNDLGTSNKLTIIWVPGHAGHEGNEMADKLAKEGSLKEVGDQKYTAPHANAILKIEKYSKRQIIKQYKKTSEHSQVITNKILEKANMNIKKVKKIFIELNVEDIGILSRVLSGHNNLNYHQNRIQLSYDTGCEYCEDKKAEETTEHILTKCPKFSSIRKEKMGDYYIKTEDIGKQQTCIKTIERIISFFKKIDILNKPIKLKRKDLSPTRSWGNRKRKISTRDSLSRKKHKSY